jgi:hypothetical protein
MSGRKRAATSALPTSTFGQKASACIPIDKITRKVTAIWVSDRADPPRIFRMLRIADDAHCTVTLIDKAMLARQDNQVQEQGRSRKQLVASRDVEHPRLVLLV